METIQKMPERVIYVTGMATNRVARALPPTPMPDTKVSENTLYTMASLLLCGSDGRAKNMSPWYSTTYLE